MVFTAFKREILLLIVMESLFQHHYFCHYLLLGNCGAYWGINVYQQNWGTFGKWVTSGAQMYIRKIRAHSRSGTWGLRYTLVKAGHIWAHMLLGDVEMSSRHNQSKMIRSRFYQLCCEYKLVFPVVLMNYLVSQFQPFSSTKTDRRARKYPLKWQWCE